MQNLIFIPAVALSTLIALAVERFSDNPYWKEHKGLGTALYIGIFFATVTACQLVVHQPSAYLLGVMGFWIGIRITEMRRSRKARREWQTSLNSQIARLLDERVTPTASIEVDITDCSEQALTNKITELTKAGFTVVTTRNHNTNKRTLTVSGEAH